MVITLIGYMASHAISKVQELDSRIDRNETNIATLMEHKEDVENRLDRMETKLDKILSGLIQFRQRQEEQQQSRQRPQGRKDDPRF